MPELKDEAAALQEKLKEHKGTLAEKSDVEKKQSTREMREEAKRIREEAVKKDDEETLKKIEDIEEALENLEEVEKPKPIEAPEAPPAAPVVPPVAPPPPAGGEAAAGGGVDAAKNAQGKFKIFQKVNEWLENAGTGMLKGVKTVITLMGFKDLANNLDDYISRGEVRDILRDTLGEHADVVKSKTDDRDIRKLKRRYTKTVNKKMEGKTDEQKKEIKEDYTFLTYCQEKANEIAVPDKPADGEKKKTFTIADLLRGEEPEEPAATNPDGSPKTAPNKPTEVKETPYHRKAKFVFAFAESINNVAGGTIDLDEEKVKKDLTSKTTPQYFDDVAKDIISFLTQDEGSASWWTGRWRGSGYSEAASVPLFGIELDSDTLEERDGNSWFYDQNAIQYFGTNLLDNPEVAINDLLSHTFISGKAKTAMPRLQAELKKTMQKYGIANAEAAPVNK